MNIKYLNILDGGIIKYGCDENWHECSKQTLNFGLCVPELNSDDQCNNINYDYANIDNIKLPQPDQQLLTEEDRKELEHLKNVGQTKGYIEDNLAKSCYTQTNNPTEYEYEFVVPTNFTIATINAMGIYRGNNQSVYELMRLRMQMLEYDLRHYSPTIVCFQEMSQVAFDFLYTPQIRALYPFFYEHDLIHNLKSRNKDIEVFVLSKYPMKKVTIYPLEGNLGYTNSLGVYEFNNLAVINVYMQAGSSSSPGQKYKALNYSRCRSHQLHFIQKIIDQFNNSIPCIILGDFNFNLNETNTDLWPERAQLNTLGFIDSWTGGLDLDGLTENTDINSLRWNSKFEEKRFRYDAILYKGSRITSPQSSRVIFNTPRKLVGEQNMWFEQAILPKLENRDGKEIRYSKGNNSSNPAYDLFISDHFGVLGYFTLG